MYWANFIHFYQPPTQERWIVEKVTDECYRKVVRILLDNPNGRLTVNITGSLTEQLHRYGLDDVIDGLRTLAQRGQIELTGTAMYHPIIPLIPSGEASRQIELNQAANRKYLGGAFFPKGFFPPEMCYSRQVAEIVRSAGFEWLIADELSYDGRLGSVANDRLYTVRGMDGFMIFFKERRQSAALTYGKYHSFDRFLDGVGRANLAHRNYLLTGTDGEIYGHHLPGLENLLREAFTRPEIETCTLSDLIELFPGREETETVAASWSTWEDELRDGIPYPQWKYPGNPLHELQWRLTGLALRAVEEGGGREPARSLLDQGLHSCQYWWASCRQYFNVEMIEKGADRLLEAIKAAGSPAWAVEAERLAGEIKNTARDWQRTGHARELIAEYQRTHTDVASELTFGGVR